MPDSLKSRLLDVAARMRFAIRKHVPPGLRWVVGLVLVVLGSFGILPVLGFWMIPLGIAVMAMDIAPLWRRLTGRTR